jgi:hypothetical protein
MWWLVGTQSLVQLELFQHTRPTQAPLRADWCPADLGWVRCGLSVADFDAALTVLHRRGIGLIGNTMEVGGLRRAAFRDPYVGTVIEMMEDGPSLPWRSQRARGAAIVYATSSVSDSAKALNFYRDILHFTIEPLEKLHMPEHEALWGLSHAERCGFVASAGEIAIEVVEYQSPKGRPRPSNYRACDQGMVNVALASRSFHDVEEALGRLERAGLVPVHLLRTETLMAGYINDAEREFEIIGFLPQMDSAIGFIASSPFAS